MARPVVYFAGKDPGLEIGGGHCAYVRSYARAAIRAGYEPHIFCVSTSAGVSECDYGVVHRILSRWPMTVVPGMGWWWYNSASPVQIPQLVAGVDRFLAREKAPHLLHGFAVWGAGAVTVGRRLRDRGVRAAILQSTYAVRNHEARAKLRGIRPEHGVREKIIYAADRFWCALAVTALERRANGGADWICVNYEAVERLLVSSFRKLARIRKIPYTSECAFFDSAASRESAIPEPTVPREPAGAPLIVSVSRHDPRKGVDVLLRALSLLRGRGILFRACLVGGGRLLESHRRLAAALGLGVETAIPGFVPNPRSFLRAADLFVLPSTEESSGSLSLIESMDAGLPAIASDVDGIPEDIRNEESGLLVPPNRPEMLAAAIAGLLRDAALRSRLGQAARQTFERRFSAGVVARAVGDLYAELLSQ